MPVHLTINPAAVDLTALGPALEALRQGDVIAYPTDTFYGLGADPRNARAVGRIFEVKGRGAQQSIPLIAGSVAQARAVATFSGIAERLAAAFWPGPLTLILPQAITLANGIGQRGTIALRVPDHAIARTLALGLEFPVTSTSANRTGAVAPSTARDVLDALGDQLAVIVDGGPTPGAQPSTIVDVSAGAPRLVRAGAVPWDRVLESLE